MVGTGVLGEVTGRPEELMAVKGGGKCFPRWADLDQASSGEPEPPEEVAGGARGVREETERWREKYSRALADSLRSHSQFLEISGLERTGCLPS